MTPKFLPQPIDVAGAIIYLKKINEIASLPVSDEINKQSAEEILDLILNFANAAKRRLRCEGSPK